MWLDYKGKRHFLPTEMPEEPEKLAFTVATVLVSWLWFTLLSLVGHGLDFLPAALQRPGSLQRFSALFMWGSAVYLLSQLF